MNKGRSKKLLLVEDEAITSMVTAKMLKQNGYDVVTVLNGTRAIDLVSQDEEISLILMDIDLGPGINGPETAGKILQIRDIPIVFLTSHSEREMVEKVKEITRYGYVIKNSGDFVLLSSIEMAFELFATTENLKATANFLRLSENRVRTKLDSIISPIGDIGNLELTDIIDIPMLQSLMDDFTSIIGLDMAILDLKGNVIISSSWQDICTEFHRKNPDSCMSCHESDTVLTAGIEPGTSKLYKCRNNMWDMATPIHIGGKHMGNLFLGQFFFSDEIIDHELFRAQARRYGFDEDEYMAALERVPRFSREKVSAAMDLYIKLSNIISRLSYSNISLREPCLSVTVTPRFIRKTKHSCARSLITWLTWLPALIHSIISSMYLRLMRESSVTNRQNSWGLQLVIYCILPQRKEISWTSINLFPGSQVTPNSGSGIKAAATGGLK